MKAYVWSKWAPGAHDATEGKSKCIYIGEIDHAPAQGDYVCVREGFACLKVAQTTYGFCDNTIEIIVDLRDVDNEYGPCLYAARRESE